MTSSPRLPLRKLARNTLKHQVHAHLAEFRKAEIRGLLNDAKRRLIGAKGAGVTFEARMVARVQHSAERFGLFGVRASLAAGSTDPLDVLVGYVSSEGIEISVGFQLKTGSDGYIRAAIRTVPDGHVVLVPRDVPAHIQDGRTQSAIFVGDVRVDTPTRQELTSHAEGLLDRLSLGAAPVDLGHVAREAVRASLVDGIVAGVVDLCGQLLTKPDDPVDWIRAAQAVAKTVASSSLGTFLAATHACSSVRLGRHALDAAAAYRTTRVAACVLPHAIDVAFDFARMRTGALPPRDFGKSTVKHVGAALAELAMFRFLARLASNFGPFGQAVVMIGGGFLVAKLGETAGGLLFDVLESLVGKDESPEPLATPDRAPALSGAIDDLLQRERIEQRRRSGRAKRGICEERNCGRRHHARGMCSRHYQRWWRKMRRSGWRPRRVARKHRLRP